MPTSLPAQVDSPRAWLVVIGAFLGAFVSFGVTYCFGVFLKPMSVEFHADHAKMSVLFSVISGLTFFLAPFTGEFADHYGPRPVMAAGAVLMGVALNVTAHVHSSRWWSSFTVAAWVAQRRASMCRAWPRWESGSRPDAIWHSVSQSAESAVGRWWLRPSPRF